MTDILKPSPRPLCRIYMDKMMLPICLPIDVVMGELQRAYDDRTFVFWPYRFGEDTPVHYRYLRRGTIQAVEEIIYD